MMSTTMSSGVPGEQDTYGTSIWSHLNYYSASMADGFGSMVKSVKNSYDMATSKQPHGILFRPITSKHIWKRGNSNFCVGGSQMQGWRTKMEDSHIIQLEFQNHTNTAFFAIFDGHGGDKASKFMAAHFVQKLEEMEDIHDQEALSDICLDLDRQFFSTSSNDKFVGTTATFAIVTKEEGNQLNILCGNIGDSRIVLAKRKDDGSFKAISLTEDHSPDDPLESFRIKQAGGTVVNGRVDGILAVSRAFGDQAFKVPHNVPDVQKKVCVTPQFTTTKATTDDYLFMACDGIFENDIFTRQGVIDWLQQKTLQLGDNFGKITALLQNECLSRGSYDNMSCMVIQFKDGSAINNDNILYVPGSYNVEDKDKWWWNQFSRAYGMDAVSGGLTLDQALKRREYFTRIS